jgi:S-adenosylmethionine hydrolase
MAGALTLRHSAPYFPRGSIHVVVVDPGVGGTRAPLLVEFDGGYFIGPDNGVVSLLLEDQASRRLIHLSNPTYHRRPTSATFHGRDVFAPVAAHLSRGIDPAAFGEPVSDVVRLDWPKALKSESDIEGEIVYIDNFGNLFTNIQERDLAAFQRESLTVSLGQTVIRALAQSYSAGKDGRCIALINSWGLLEIAAYKDSAQQRCRARIGDKVHISTREELRKGGAA